MKDETISEFSPEFTPEMFDVRKLQIPDYNGFGGGRPGPVRAAYSVAVL